AEAGFSASLKQERGIGYPLAIKRETISVVNQKVMMPRAAPVTAAIVIAPSLAYHARAGARVFYTGSISCCAFLLTSLRHSSPLGLLQRSAWLHRSVSRISSS